MNLIPDCVVSDWTSLPHDICDSHTHNRDVSREHFAVVNCNLDDNLENLTAFSLAIHPWDVDEAWKTKFSLLEHRIEEIQLTNNISRLLAIGETGLDKLRGGTIDQQMACFEAHLELANSLEKPVIIHCVKAFEEIIATLKRCKFQQPAIFHGFRGKPELAHQLMSKGYYLSFGPKFNPESLRIAASANHCLLETDDSGTDISDIYKAAKAAL